MNAPAHQQAMMKIASTISAAPSAPEQREKQEPERGLRVALYYATAPSKSGEKRCHYLIKYPSSGKAMKKAKKQVINTFVIGGMTSDEIANEVVVRAIGKIIENIVGSVLIYVEQDELRPKFAEAFSFFPQLRLLEEDDFEGNLLCQYAKARVVDRAKTHRREYTLKNNREAALKYAGVSYERTIHVDASCTPDSNKIGYGYVIKDEITSSTGRKTWKITHGSNIAKSSPDHGSTGAELQAIRIALLSTNVIDKDIQYGQRALTVFTDSLWSVRILKAKLKGTVPKIDHEVLPHWDKTADRIIEAIGSARKVRFEWVKGHSADHLNHAADRLAVAARRAHESATSRENHAATKEGIIKEMTMCLEGDGFRVEVTSHKASEINISHYENEAAEAGAVTTGES